ncbi:hypothetical protein FNF28_03869 [Cafeteria roenbergensis]|uniref:ATP-grasp domain-containing protein n=1 Tax=Cafeteria roenbergensis TaxID=33653 RepID=A0A5A8DGQ5_CAFRO|nr:hypothetical protein FNF28_03869 [Cafeteria roenbergensis]
MVLCFATSSRERKSPPTRHCRSAAQRFLNLHEYQSKELMEKYGVRVQKGDVAHDAASAGAVSEKLKSENPGAELIVKAQIHAGGRGKGTFTNGFKGGVHICTDAATASEKAEGMIGGFLVTKQTGPEGQLGGMDIEEVAEKNPSAIIKEPVDIATGLLEAQSEAVAAKLGFEGDMKAKAAKQFRALYDLFIGSDATQVEINPLAIGAIPGAGEERHVFAVDAKLNFDDNAAYRQKDIFAMRDIHMEDRATGRPRRPGLNYIGLDAASAASSTALALPWPPWTLSSCTAAPPPTSSTWEAVPPPTRWPRPSASSPSDPNVKGLLVNIFGGIMKCDTIAEGIVAAAKEVGLKVPLVVRLEGTNVEAGKQILRDSGVALITADDLDDAAAKAVKAVQEA